MTKKSFIVTLAAGLLASVALATPSQAGTEYLVTTDVTFSVASPGTASDVSVTYSPSVDPIANLMITKMGGLSGISITESGSIVTVDFTKSAGTTSTLEWTFETNTLVGSYSSGLSGVPLGDHSTLNATVSVSSVPEPTSMALLGIGMTGFLAFRRLFKRNSVA